MKLGDEKWKVWEEFRNKVSQAEYDQQNATVFWEKVFPT